MKHVYVFEQKQCTGFVTFSKCMLLLRKHIEALGRYTHTYITAGVGSTTFNWDLEAGWNSRVKISIK